MTLRFGIQPGYVLDSMEMYEIRALMKYEYYSHKDSWEQTRFISYITAQVNSTKLLKLSDIISLYWEDETSEVTSTIKQSDIDRLRAKAEAYLKNNPQN